MPTIAELITETQTKQTAVETNATTAKQKIREWSEALEQAERRRALLKTRLEALQILAGEP